MLDVAVVGGGFAEFAFELVPEVPPPRSARDGFQHDVSGNARVFRDRRAAQESSDHAEDAGGVDADDVIAAAT